MTENTPQPVFGAQSSCTDCASASKDQTRPSLGSPPGGAPGAVSNRPKNCGRKSFDLESEYLEEAQGNFYFTRVRVPLVPTKIPISSLVLSGYSNGQNNC